jgi:putative ABC transport system permease protein
VTALFTIALGIGATTAIFSVVYATLFEPMAYPKPDQLVMVWSKQDGRGFVSAGDYLDWKRRSKSFQQMGAWTSGPYNVATKERPEQIDGSAETPGFFTMLGIRMMLGRDFLPEEGEVGKEHVVIISHRLWETRFGADAEIIGKQIRMNGEGYTVVGVAPPGLVDRHPFQLWVPLVFKPEQVNLDAHFILVMVRLQDDVRCRRRSQK